MAEKTFDVQKEERFDFVLTVNGNLVCRRNFAINNFQEKSLGSVHLTDAVMDCMKMIDNDLKEKTNIYNELTAPQVFQNVEEMNKWVANPTFKLNAPSFVVLRESEEVYTWDGEKMNLYTKPFNRNDYAGERSNSPCVLKFAFLDNGEEVRSVVWDGNQYPKFVRTNIDISNSKNKFEQEGTYAPYEAYIVNQFNKDRHDIIPEIKRRLNYACNGQTVRYFSKIRYGSREYDLNLKGYNERLFLNMKKQRG